MARSIDRQNAVATVDGAAENKRGSHASPFQQNPISPRPGLSRNALTTPGKIKTTWLQ